MTTKQEYLDSLKKQFIDTVADPKKRRSKTTIDGYGWLIGKWHRRLQDAGYDANPKKWTEPTILYLREAGITRREMSILSNYSTFHGNTIIKDLELEWPRDERWRVDWLSPEQAMQVTEAAQGIERIVINLELNMGLRRVEVLRLKVTDIQMGYMHVLGKGRQGGKPRTVAFHPSTLAELNLYHMIREAEIAKARAKNPAVVVPDSLLIYERKGELHAYQRSAVDKMLAKVSEKVGFKFTNHTLRRTFGRMLWLAGVPIETISKILGHEDTKTTIAYLGLNVDDQASAMQKIAEFQRSVNYRENGSSQMEKWTERDFCPPILLARH